MLRLREVGKRYGPRTVLRDVNLALSPGSVTLLAGANGSGKSTLLRIAAGLARPGSGVVECAPPPGSIGYLGHQTLLYPGLSALENLRFWAKVHGMRVADGPLLACLERMELRPFALDAVRGFSRGMAQRLALARIFLLSPALILMDEPGAGLDSPSQDLLYREIRAARERGAAVLWVTHTPDQDRVHADAVAVLEKTRLRLEGLQAAEPVPAEAALC